MANEIKEIKRVNYYDQQFLRAEDFKAEQEYHMMMRQRWHNLSVHGIGVVEGLHVVYDGTDQLKYVWLVGPGMAIDAAGREVVLSQAKRVSTPFVADQKYYIAIKHYEVSCDAPNDEFAVNKFDWTRLKLQPIVGAYRKGELSSDMVILAAVENVQLSFDERINQQVSKYQVPLVPQQTSKNGLIAFVDNNIDCQVTAAKEGSVETAGGILLLDLPQNIQLTYFGYQVWKVYGNLVLTLCMHTKMPLASAQISLELSASNCDELTNVFRTLDNWYFDRSKSFCIIEIALSNEANKTYASASIRDIYIGYELRRDNGTEANDHRG